MSLSLPRKLLQEPLNTALELVRDNVPGSRRVIVSVMPCPWIGSLMRQGFPHAQLLRNKSPVLIESFKFPNQIGKHISIGIHEPIHFVTVRGLLNAGSPAVQNPSD